MPNWCYTSVCFKGKPENIMNLRNDISLATEFSHKHHDFVNLRYLFSLKGFDTVSYSESIKSRFSRPNFRGSVYDSSLKEEESGDHLLYYPYFEFAWDNDYHALQLIAKLYNVEFSAYSDEPNMGVYTKCSNGNIDTYDFDFSILPDYEQLEEAMEKDPTFDMDYEISVKQEDMNEIINILNERNIEYDINVVEEVQVPNIHGIYYKYIFGVDYEDKKHEMFRYPELDRFNINNNVSE